MKLETNESFLTPFETSRLSELMKKINKPLLWMIATSWNQCKNQIFIFFWNCKATAQNQLMPSQTDSSKPKPDPCQRYACRIQDCLQKNNYQESKCVKFIRDLEECCKKFAGKSPTVCQGIRFDLPDTNGERRLWLQSRYKPYFQNFS